MRPAVAALAETYDFGSLKNALAQLDKALEFLERDDSLGA
jgi:hypothetical protein